MEKNRVLLVDDEPSIIRFLRGSLEAEGWKILTASDGVKALEVFNLENVDLVILDIMMPNMDGFEACRQIREWSQVPIIMLSARADVADKAKCLQLGADDYVVKPFSKIELLARVAALMRRCRRDPTASTTSVFKSGNLEVHFAPRRVIVDGREIKLTRTEYNILQELVQNAGKVLTHAHLLNKVWGDEYRDEKEYLHVFIGHLRHKLEGNLIEPKHIITIPGIGYQFNEQPVEDIQPAAG